MSASRDHTRVTASGFLAVALVAVAAAFFLAAARGPHQADPPPAGRDTALAEPVAGAAPLGRSDPVRLRIPRIGVDTALGRSGTTARGSLAAPPDFAHASWFDGGASPGEPGAAVLLGHVDSTAGPAVFFRLGELGAGDEVLVTRQDGTTARFVVDRTETVAKNAFPSDRVFADDGTARLWLITCGGSFDAAQRRYLSNVLASAVFVGAELTTPGHEPELAR
ncbi:class F sortase [Nocardia rhizosphaerae]|uniref:Class F sortase n=1 Tax=Nocardia rhizosphaerae TaxID=1691571 RepID=A0ABV8LES9_9NOCA